MLVQFLRLVLTTIFLFYVYYSHYTTTRSTRTPSSFFDVSIGQHIQLLANQPLLSKLSAKNKAVEEYQAPAGIDLTVAGRRLLPNPQREVIHTATILARIRKVERDMNAQIERNHHYYDQLDADRQTTILNTPDIQGMLHTLAQQQEQEIQEYLKAKLKTTEWLQTAEVEMYVFW